MSQAFVALCMLIVFFGLCWCAITAEETEKKQRRTELERKREEAEERRKFLAKEQTQDLKGRGRHITQIRWTPSVVHLAPQKPEEPKPANVAQLRRKQ
jgi:hypothetical protein